jgi:hypothetical protein
MIKSLDRKLAAIHADTGCREFILADAKDADMALGLGAPGKSPEMHAGEVRFKTLAEYREQMRLITRQGLVDIMLMSASSSHALTIDERLFDHSPVTPAVRANDTTDIHLARGGGYSAEPARPFRSASIDDIQCGHFDCTAEERALGADLGLYSVTFNNDLERDLETLEHFLQFREEAQRKGFRYFLEVFDPNIPSAVAVNLLPHYINDMITRMLAGVPPAGRPVFLKIVYHGPKAMEELVRYDPHLIVGILGGSSGTTRDAFQLLSDAQKYGARVALFGRKINQAENQLAFVHFLRLIVDGQIGPVDAVKAYHAVLGKLGIAPLRSLENDLKITEQSMSYVAKPAVVVSERSRGVITKTSALSEVVGLTSSPATTVSENRAPHCACQRDVHQPSASCECKKAKVTESMSTTRTQDLEWSSNGRPDCSTMSPADRLLYHRRRLGLGR